MIQESALNTPHVYVFASSISQPVRFVTEAMCYLNVFFFLSNPSTVYHSLPGDLHSAWHTVNAYQSSLVMFVE